MANVLRRLPQNVPGEFFVDSSCINCNTCSQLAPEIFRDHGEQCSVHQQPLNNEQIRLALMSLVACPTGSIGSSTKRNARIGIDAFPLHLADGVYFCGFTSEASFGGWSYLIQRRAEDGGNVLVDSPRYTSHLVKRIAELGGVSQMFLTHKDDVADHQRFADRFGCRRIMHAADGAARLNVEKIIQGTDQVEIDTDLLAIPTPGHTRGHVVFLYKDKFLFSGDHLAWSPVRQTLTAFRSVAWYSWPEQIRSMEKLLRYRFEWVLPGHGDLHHDNAELMHAHLENCVAWMSTQ
jgi:glyoxylase-like metal-dependent hydrolase (beta-lactamase superfamily II)/ferredoxin